MKRSPLPPRPSRLRSTKPPKRKPRKPSEARRVYGPPGRIAFVKSLGCCVQSPECHGEIHNHHTANGGAGRKADWGTIIPLCTHHHATLHSIGPRSFEGAYGVDVKALAAEVERRWQEQSDTGDAE